MAESSKQQDGPDRPDGDDSSPQASAEAESVEPDADPDAAVAAVHLWLELTYNKAAHEEATGGLTRLLHQRRMMDRDVGHLV